MDYQLDFSNFEIWLLATLLFLVRYAVIAGLLFIIFYAWKRKDFFRLKLQQKFPSNIDIKRELFYSVMTFIIYGSSVCVFVYWSKNEMTNEYKDFSAFGAWYFVFSILLMIVMHDTYFYWTHRLMHHRAFFKYVHKTHHSFHNPTPWAAFAFHPLESIISMGIIPIIIFLIPFHQWALIVFVTLLTLNNVLIHLGYRLPKFMKARFQNTAVEHDLHHNGFQKNYGLYFTLWDKLMGTYYRMNTKEDF
ncbi:sterol desaturase family protein [Gelidibacter salicanalis]|uniref:Sterol desaturase family protein n=1 Tax=Gelidibacter salicanalis TaxID=291193 RepID=A0A5C7AP00_9FLAO|nr:sterol desaturase family protein [Gelidibacter salicanalis]TXE09303.1 sterol desaturase family protein [Gelidibacter salicanalis]